MVEKSPEPNRGSVPTDSRQHLPRGGGLLPLSILPQPNDETCGPTCLHAVYRYWGEDCSLHEVIESARSLNIAGAGRGTLAVMLGVHALTKGYRARLFTFNLNVFDPTWFDREGKAGSKELIDKLLQQRAAKSDAHHPRFGVATESYVEFLRLGGRIRLKDLTSRLISGFIRRGMPVLTGLSATYLYRCAREFGPNDDYDDIRGEPSGHFVILHGYDAKARSVSVADPLENNPGFETQQYSVSMGRLVPAIMLGVLTYDANLLVIEPAQATGGGGS
jgi:hypothetical protein